VQASSLVRKSSTVIPWSYSEMTVECDPHPFLVGKAAVPGDLVDISI
jgi:hypothetical protein